MEDIEKVLGAFISKEKDYLNPKELCDVEKLLWLFNAIEPKGNAEDAWAILVGYNSPVISLRAEEEYGKELYNIRRMLPKLSFKKRWQEYLQEYKKLDKKIRLYEINEFGKIEENIPQICSNRAKGYREALINYESIKAKDIKMACAGIFYYERKKRDLINYRWKEEGIERFSGMIPKSLVKLNHDLLTAYRDKKELYLKEDFNWKNFMEGMPAKGWTERPIIELQHYLKGEKRSLDYKNSIHIIGGLGAGKSNYKLAETYRLVTQCGAKVGIVESDVSNIIETKRRLRELGLNVAVIIGRTNEDKHLNKYIRAKSNDINGIYDYSKAEFGELGSLSGACFLAAEAEDYKVKPREFLCKSIVQLGTDKKLICPLFNKCGAYKELRTLIDADVWIGTPHSILLSKIPAVIDPYERTYYEAFYDLLDVIFIDEVDSIQKTFDSIFVPTFTLVGDNNQLLDKFKSVDQTISSRGLVRTESRMYTWAINLKHLETALLRTLRMVSNSKTIEGYLSTRTVTSNQIFSELKSKLEREPVNDKFIKKLESYLKYVQDTDLDYEFLDHELYKLYDMILKVQNIGVDHIEIEKLIKQEFENLNVVIPQNEKGKQLNKDLIYQQFEFFIYLVQIDFWVRILNKEYPYIKEKIGDEYENLMVFEGISKEMKSFIAEPMTGVMFGYKFVKLKDIQNTIKIELVRYNGVGRYLLENWHQIKKLNGQTGPATVMFSGTSYAPGSPHYNLSKLPTWILKSSISEGEIYQKFLPKSDPSKNGELIKVSGINYYEQRNLQIKKLTQLCTNDFENELKHWRLKGENRKILIIVNSYDNCMQVAEELEKHIEFQGRFKVLTIEANDDKEYYYHRELLEYFRDTNADILVAPLIVIERGYNILKKNSNQSYFGSVFFLIRPYMTPGDLDSQIQILHANLPEFIKRADNSGLKYGKAIENIRKSSFILLYKLYSQKNFWNKLKPLERKIMSWFTLIPVKQTIGRLQRGGTDCRVFYVDGAFAPEISKRSGLNDKKSMLRAWEEILSEQDYDVFARELYGSFLLGLKKAIREIDETLEDSEIEY